MYKTNIQSADFTAKHDLKKLHLQLDAKYLEAAIALYGFGFNVIPILPYKKQTAVKWTPWLSGLSLEKIKNYWGCYPNHELGFILGNHLVVMDADSPAAVKALYEIEKDCGCIPNMIVKTRKGEHHYFKLPRDLNIKSQSFSTEKYPEKIDIKTGRTMVILPPSTGKLVLVCEAQNVDDLVPVSQDFIEALLIHNGCSQSHPDQKVVSQERLHAKSPDNLEKITAMLSVLDPDCSRDQWIRVGMAIKYENAGEDSGFDIWDAWSKKGKKYPGRDELAKQWKTFNIDHKPPVTIATIKKLVTDAGYDWMSICAGEQFTPCEMEVVEPEKKMTSSQSHTSSHRLEKYSLIGRSSELEKSVVNAVPVLGNIALKGQATVIYAAPNTGKTLISLWLITEGVKAGLIEPSKLYYMNMDDSAKGLMDKVQLAEEYGFHMLAEGYNKFKGSEFLKVIRDMIDNDDCHDIVIVLDTLKKFTNLMDKQKASSFANLVRNYVLKGGTLIALAHTNKNFGHDGNPVYSGTSDIVDDFDCAYRVKMVGTQDDELKIVEFENFKSRGNVALRAAYCYSVSEHNSYAKLLLTVREINPDQLEPIKQDFQSKADSEVIATVIDCIHEGVNTKMRLAEATANKAAISKRSALDVIERYTGNDPSIHKWRFSIRDRGAKVFELLKP